MLIKRLKINYYKSIKQVMDLPLLNINIIIGQNNTGKSNILDAIQFALQSARPEQSIFYEQADLELDLEFTHQEQVKYQLPEPLGKFILRHGQRELVFSRQTLDYNKVLNKILVKAVKRLDEAAFADLKQIQADYNSLFEYPGLADKFASSLKHHFPKISATRNALDINYEGTGLYEGQRRVTIDRLGQGFRRIFTMLLYIFHPEYPIVMIDEPETHLHPAMVERLLWAMQNSQGSQILFTTHSPLFVTPMTLPQVFRVIKNEQSTQTFHFNHHYYDAQRLLQELNADNLEMFFADQVIMVEGMSDKLLLRGLIDNFYQGDKDIKVIQMQGKGNVKIYADLLNIFQIPFSIVLDKDIFYNHGLDDLRRNLGIDYIPGDQNTVINTLKKQHRIFIFPNGDLEANYPKKYQLDNSKSLNALRAASQIDDKEYQSKTMTHLREIIESL